MFPELLTIALDSPLAKNYLAQSTNSDEAKQLRVAEKMQEDSMDDLKRPTAGKPEADHILSQH